MPKTNKIKSLNNVDAILCSNGLNYVTFKNKNSDMSFLIDTGASVSIIFQCQVSANDKVNTNKQIAIRGISGSTKTCGSVFLNLITNNIEVGHEFHILPGFENEVCGIIGSDFLQKYSANINFERFNISLTIKNTCITLPLESHFDIRTTLPARCQIVKYFKTDMTDDCVVLSSEISEGVFIGNAIVRPNNNKEIPIRILNTRDEPVHIRNFRPKIANASDYEMCNFECDSSKANVKRIDKVLKLIDSKHLSEDEKFSLQRVCAKYSDIFYLEEDTLSVTNILKQKINLQPNTTPVYIKPYRLPFSQKDQIHTEINKLLKAGIIEETKSEWSSPLLIVPKKVDENGNKKWRVVIDYRLLNKNIKDDKFPLPSITDILDSLSGAVYFSHLDLAQGYYQIELEKESRPITAFTTDRGQYQMKRLPMGLKISPSAFSRAMTVAMSGLNYESCFIYLDDLIVFGRTLLKHNQNLTKVFERLRNVNLKLNPQKCQFLKKEICYLGHTISAEGVLPNPDKVRSIEIYPTPKDANETKRFVALANYYRRHIKDFAKIAAPLNRLGKKDTTFIWDEECDTAFNQLKAALTNPPVLQYPDFSDSNIFTLRTDASGYAIGAILSNSNDKPVAYASRALNKAEKNYCTIEKELLAIVWGVKHFRPYLYGRKFKIFTDHRPLIYLFGMNNPSSRLTKFRLVLEEYDFEIEYVRGKQNVTADALSRILITSDELKDIQKCREESVLAITRQQARKTNDEGESCELNKQTAGHPGLVELLKKPKDAVMLEFINTKLFNEILRKEGCISNDDIVYDKKARILFTKQEVRSALSLAPKWRTLAKFCNNNEIEELSILKNELAKENIKALAQTMNCFNVKLSIIQNAKRITDKDTKQLIMNDFHMIPTGGHAGINRMYNTLKRYYVWNNMRADIEKFVKHCNDCQRNKYSRKTVEPLTITTTATSAFQKVYLDLVGPLPQDQADNRYILTLQCDLSKFVEAYALPNKETETVAKSFVDNFILRYGIPEEIVTDRGTEFMSSTIKEICQLLKIKHLNSTAYHHETLGSLENTHKHLGAYLRTQMAGQTDTWSNWIAYWCFAFNNTVHTETKYTPYELVFGKVSNLPSSIITKVEPLYNFEDYPRELKYRLQQAWSDSRSNLIGTKVKRKEKYDLKTNTYKYKVGDLILVKNESGNKLEPIYKGPFMITDIIPPNLVINLKNETEELIHMNRTKLFIQ